MVDAVIDGASIIIHVTRSRSDAIIVALEWGLAKVLID
jgi:hypothetical protein